MVPALPTPPAPSTTHPQEWFGVSSGHILQPESVISRLVVCVSCTAVGSWQVSVTHMASAFLPKTPKPAPPLWSL